MDARCTARQNSKSSRDEVGPVLINSFYTGAGLLCWPRWVKSSAKAIVTYSVSLPCYVLQLQCMHVDPIMKIWACITRMWISTIKMNFFFKIVCNICHMKSGSDVQKFAPSQLLYRKFLSLKLNLLLIRTLTRLCDKFIYAYRENCERKRIAHLGINQRVCK